MDKQMIEEMGRMIRLALEYGDFSHLNIHDKDRFLTGRNYIATAENLYKLGYRKIPENAVVLTRGEWDKYQTTNRDWNAIYFDGIEKTRKETAEKFAEKIKEELYKYLPKDEDFEFIVNEICKEITGNEE